MVASSSQGEAESQLESQLSVIRLLFMGFDYSGYFNGSKVQRLQLLSAAIEHLERKSAAEQFVHEVVKFDELSKQLLQVDRSLVELVVAEMNYFAAVGWLIEGQQERSSRRRKPTAPRSDPFHTLMFHRAVSPPPRLPGLALVRVRLRTRACMTPSWTW